MKSFLLLIVFLFCLVPLSAQKKKVAVFESFGTSITDDMKQAVVDVIQEGIFNSQQYTVLERTQIAGVMKEFEFQNTGVVDDEQLLKMGKAAGADYTCFASITAFGSNFQIACKLIEAESAELKYSKSMRTKSGMDDFGEVLEFIANEMFSGKSFTVSAQKQIPEIKCPKCCKDGDGYVDGYISESDEAAATWEEAMAFCKNKGADWYLPDRGELRAVYNRRSDIENNGGKKFQSKDYWSSSKRNNFDIYYVNFKNGSEGYYDKTARNLFRCVRLS
jgi:hypothetical protein